MKEIEEKKSSDLSEIISQYEEAILRYKQEENELKKARMKSNIAAFLWFLCIIVQLLANLDRILLFLH